METIISFFIDGEEYEWSCGSLIELKFIPSTGDLIELPKDKNRYIVESVLHQFIEMSDIECQHSIEITLKMS